MVGHMKLKFDATLAYQRSAIDSVVQIFDGQPLAESSFSVSLASYDLMGTVQTDLGLGNQLTLTDKQILANVNKIQESNNIPKVTELLGRHFSVEMETGTGKTYVYLRSIFELNKVYGFTKFIIVVPSVAIREGVLASIHLTREHFRTLYGKPFDSIEYDSKSLGKVRQFATANTIQVMVINIQSFQKDVKDNDEISRLTSDQLKKLNVINRESDKLSGRKPIEFIQATAPIVILDEPQSVEGNTLQGETTSSRAISRLNPLVTLRYSATHKNYHNLLYKLNPIQAYDLRLVKRIEVASMRAEDNSNDAYIKLLLVENKNSLRAKIQINVSTGSGVTQKAIWVKKNDDLFLKSKERQEYQNGYIVHNIIFSQGAECIEFSNGKRIALGDALAGLDEEIMKAQVRETIEQHLMKECMVKGKGIKVLSLFFIDRVANYRIYNADGTISLGKIGHWFEESFRDLTNKSQYKGLINHSVEEIHGGYFSKDKKGGYKDTSGTTKDDDETYHLIMRDKEGLLSLEKPLRFIFSHTALREGWDNPNVFQICTLNESKSLDRKRQEIGRGLRLPVNQNGERIHDETINRLTVIANESYEDFARTLQKEYEEDYGIEFGAVPHEAFAKLLQIRNDQEVLIGQENSKLIWNHLNKVGYIDKQGHLQDLFDPKNRAFKLEVLPEFDSIRDLIVDELQRYVFKDRIVNARDRKQVKLTKSVMLDPAFEELWKRISQRTRYRVSFSTKTLVDIASNRIREMPKISPLRIDMDKVMISPTQAGVTTSRVMQSKVSYLTGKSTPLPDLLAYLQNETELTRHTLVEILLDSGRLNDFEVNPQAFITMAIAELNKALNDLILNGIHYEKIIGQHWEMHRLVKDDEDGLLRYLNNLYEVQNKNKSLYDHVEFDSEIERNFARDLDSNEKVKVFVKLPAWFRVDTPLGPYNPDWAIVLEDGDQLYLVRETKSTLDEDKRRKEENAKLACGRKHFKAIDVDFDVAVSFKDVLHKLSIKS